jgi:hypothetical protein
MVFPEVIPGSSETMNVLPALREATLVWTLTLPNSVIRQFGMSSVNALSSSGVGLSNRASASVMGFLVGKGEPRDSTRPN